MTKRYHISSTASVDYGIYEGGTTKEAFLAMVKEAGGTYGDEATGTEEDWIITEAETEAE